MNKIEQFEQALVARLKGVSTSLDAPDDPSGHWFLDAKFGRSSVVVEWKASRGFGVSTDDSSGIGEAPDESYSDAAVALERVVTLLSSGEKTAPPQEESLRDLRSHRRMSQAELAERLGMQQGTISKIENGADVSVSTLKQLIGALGGELELVARFSGYTVRITQTR